MRKSRKRIRWFPYVLLVLAAVLLVLIAANVLESRKIQRNSEELQKEIQSLRKAAEELEKTENMEAENKNVDHTETGAELQEEESVETEKEDQAEEAAVENREEAVENDREDPAQEGNGRKIALDPGHQGPGVGDDSTEPQAPDSEVRKAKYVSGTQGTTTGVPEYELNLTIALKLRDELTARGYEVVLTREDNETAISNVERAQLASREGADIMVRIHADGSEDSSANGAMTMIPSAENPYVGNLHDQSRLLGEAVINTYCAATGIKNNGVQLYDNMTGINWSQIPVIILEMGFMTNPDDDMKMQDAEVQRSMVQGIADGIDLYFEQQ